LPGNGPLKFWQHNARHVRLVRTMPLRTRCFVIVYHVCTLKKLKRYETTGRIIAPVRAWETIEQAQRMSLSTGRRVILRLRFPDDAPKLPGHSGQARVLHHDLLFDSF
jgi:hypothetical protein